MRMNKPIWMGVLGFAGTMIASTAQGDGSIRQPPSISPIPVVAHVSIFDLDTLVVDPALPKAPAAPNRGTGQDQESIIEFREPRTVLNAPSRPTFHASPLRFIHSDESPQEGDSFPSGYLKEGSQKNEPTPAKSETANNPSLPAQGSEAAAIGPKGEAMRAGENGVLVESQAVPAERQAVSAEGIVPADVTDGVVVEGAGEPVSMPGDRAGCTRSCIP